MPVYLAVKHLHMTLALISIAGFILRGILHLRRSGLVRTRFARVAPHVVDTTLFLTGLWLAWLWRVHEVFQPWLGAKLVALLAYIALGVVAFRLARTAPGQAVAWGAAVAVFLYMFAVARTKLVIPLTL
jgi:uncharacterized membrane protein SirB2